ncbi:MAG: hypothetical protein IJ722_02350 [Alloprevotella sp.]|nr:hypothetical protein [Alloprevotella sp.]
MTRQDSIHKDWLAFIIGLFAYVQVRILGTFAVGELVLFAITPFIAFKKFWHDTRARHFVYMGLVWLAGVMFADIWNRTPLVDHLKGVFNVVFLIALVPAVYWLLHDRPRRLLYYYGGAALSMLFNFYVQRSYDVVYEFEVWRVYAFYPLAIFAAGFLYYKGRHLLSYAVVMAFGVWSLYNMSRNIFLTQSIAVAILFYMDLVAKRHGMVRAKVKKRVSGVIFFLLVALFFVDYTYESLASSGALGTRAAQKYWVQKRSDRGLASGRGDAFVSLYLIGKNPIVGYGSYAKDKDKVAHRYIAKHSVWKPKYKADNLLPGHSYILGAWVYAGILGFAFFAYILVLLWRAFYTGVLFSDLKLMGLNIYLLMMLLWNILFSPFAHRINFVFFIMAVMILWRRYDRQEAAIKLS